MDKNRFIELLNENYQWPTVYQFKFVVSQKNSEELLAIFFGMGEANSRQSKNGNYISITFNIQMDSSEAVYLLYERASKIEGIICL